MMRGVAVRRSAGVGRRAAVAGVSAAVMIGLLGACDSSQPAPTEAPVSPTSTTIVTPSPTPTDTPISEPTKPAEMERSDEVGAVAAAKYFMRLFSEVMTTGDLTRWDAIADPECGFCSNVSTEYGDIYGSGGRQVGGTFTITDVSHVGYDDLINVHAVQFRYTSEPAQILDPRGSLVRTVDPGAGYVILDVANVRGEWHLLSGDRREEPVG